MTLISSIKIIIIVTKVDISCYLSFNVYCCAIFFLSFENFEVNCLLAFVLGLECQIALVYLISPSNELL